MFSRFIGKSPDYDAMRQFYDATRGRDKWLDRTGWMNEKGLRGWKGVKLNEDGRVKELFLKGNACTGSIPPTLGGLSVLLKLDLSSNKLSGSIPPEIGSLSQLTLLHLFKNELTGPIPSTIGNLKKLIVLHIWGNNLTGSIPPTLGGLPALSKLILSQNKLSGSIPPEIGSLSRLTYLGLSENELRGPIPSAIGDLKALTGLLLWGNNISGSIPPTLGGLSALSELDLGKNKLSGPIPSAIGNLKALTVLYLWGNNLTGYIPPTLGGLSVLLKLDLSRNNLSGYIPPTLGGLSVLLKLDLSSNMLSGSLPPEIGTLSHLTFLQFSENELTGDLPVSFSNLTSLKELNCQQRDGFIVSGGPIPEESMDTWRVRLKSRDRRFSPTTLVTHSAEAAMERIDNSPVPSQSQLVLPSELLRLTRENRVMLDEVMDLTDRNSATFDALPEAESLRELDRLVGMAKHLEEIGASKIEDDDMEQRERSLVQDSMEKAHYITLKNGLCKAYLASCVVGSKLVSASQTGTMGMAGKALKFIAGVTPVLGGLASVAAAALKSGDHYVQTQRVIKISEMASDVVECSKIAKRVAMKITEGLRVGDIITKGARVATNIERVGRAPFDTAGLGGTLGGLQDSVDADAVLDWFVEEVASDASDSIADATTLTKDGKHYGEKHLCMLLKAIGRDCLSNVTDIDAKIEALTAVLLRRDLPKTGLSELPKEQTCVDTSAVRAFPVVLSSGGTMGGSNTLDTAPQSDVEALRARLAAMEATEAKRADEIEVLKRQNSEFRKKFAKLEDDGKDDEVSGTVAAGGGQLYANKQVRQSETAEGFWARVEKGGSSGDHGSMVPEALERLEREKKVIQEEKVEMLEERVARLEDVSMKKQTKTAHWRGKK